MKGAGKQVMQEMREHPFAIFQEKLNPEVAAERDAAYSLENQYQAQGAEGYNTLTNLWGIKGAIRRGAKGVGKKATSNRKVNGRRPINSAYAGKTYPASQLPEGIRNKYPHGVPFNNQGFPDFSRYRISKVKIKLTGSRSADFSAANRAAGFRSTPDGYTWHHHHEPGVMELVPTDLHRAVKHTGGVAVSPLSY